MSFDFKQFSIDDRRCAMKVGTDGVLLGAWCELPSEGDLHEGDVHVADLGAGSGIIALMIAQRWPPARITAVEIDPDAAADCAGNFALSPFASRLEVMNASAAEYAPEAAPELIVTNPPFFTNGELSPSSARRTARHQNDFGPCAAIEIAARLLSESGDLAMVTPADDEDRLLFQAELHRLRLRRLCRVSTVAGREPTRLLWQFSRLDVAPEITSLAIRTTDNGLTPEYVDLVKDFYLKM